MNRVRKGKDEQEEDKKTDTSNSDQEGVRLGGASRAREKSAFSRVALFPMEVDETFVRRRTPAPPAMRAAALAFFVWEGAPGSGGGIVSCPGHVAMAPLLQLHTRVCLGCVKLETKGSTPIYVLFVSGAASLCSVTNQAKAKTHSNQAQH